MADFLLENDIDLLEKRGINRYKAVIMASREARFLNDQVRLGIIKPKGKISSLALQKLFDGRIVESDEAEA